MIKINRKQDCCGCRSCVQRCQQKCISFVTDEEGFGYPQVDTEHCIDCHLCEKVCPVINQSKSKEPASVFAAVNQDEEVRRQSSSGGVFSALAESVLEKGGVVFGACFNKEWRVVHDYTEDKEGLERFRGSKYVQSDIGETYKQAEEFLKAGRQVLFSGTPCQIAGLRKFLRKDYQNLLAVDIICHGVPSPMVFKRYLDEVKEKQKGAFEFISFRDKRIGWKKFSFSIRFVDNLNKGNTVLFSQPFNENLFMKGFLKNIYLRPSCYHCSAKNFTSGSDITLGDLWGAGEIVPDMDDDKGLSAVIINTNKGKTLFDQLKLKKNMVDLSSVVQFNSMLYESVKVPANRLLFYKEHDVPVQDRIEKLTGEKKRSIIDRFLYRIKVTVWKIIHPNTH